MSTTQHTGHYNLPTFGDNPNDRPSWRGDFTDAMTKIDNQMYANATNITTATAAANNATTAAGEAKKAADNAAELAQTNKTDIGELDGYFGKLGVTSPQTAQNLMDTINGKAENTALTALQGTVSTLSGKVDGKADSSSVYTKSQADTTFTRQGGYSGTAQQLNQAIQTNASGIAEAKAGIEEIKPQLTQLNNIANGLTGATKWTGTNITRTIGAFHVNMWVYYNEPSGLFCVFGEMFSESLPAGTDFRAGFTELSDTAALFPQAWRPSTDVEIPMYAMTTSGSTVRTASLMIKPTGTLEVYVGADAIPGSGNVSIDIRFWGQLCSIGLVKTLGRY